jgi:hypothetical protein
MLVLKKRNFEPIIVPTGMQQVLGKLTCNQLYA